MRIINSIEIKVAPVGYVTPIIIEVNELRVVTTEQLADFYGCTAKQIKQNFNNNKKHFIEGKHFFKLEGETLEEVRNALESVE